MKNNGKHSDLRMKRTRTLLWRALQTLILKTGKQFKVITVNEICDQAMVHRTTFYKHFVDKYDLLEYGFNQLYTEYRSTSSPEVCRTPLSRHDFRNVSYLLSISF